MKKLYFLLLLWATHALAAPVDPLSTSLKALDRYIEKRIGQEKVIGCAVAVVFQGKVVFLKAYGVKKKGKKDPVDLNTVFQLGSISKTVSSTLIALLKKQKLLSLSDPMGNYYSHILPTTQIQHLLSHTAGYARKGWNQKIEEGIKRPELLKHLAESPQETPGETYDYHNLVFSLIQNVVEKICEQPFDEALKRRIFHPLKMTRTTAGFRDFNLQPNRAWPHQGTQKGRWQPSKDYSHFYHEAVSSAAGVNSSITDMARFLKLQMGGSPDFLSSQDLAEFHQPFTEAPDGRGWFKKIEQGDVYSQYGLGWRIVDYECGHLVYHGGYVKGFKNFLGFLPDSHIGIVILNNTEGEFSFKAAMMFLDQYIKESLTIQ
jgi:beta-lactamase class C